MHADVVSSKTSVRFHITHTSCLVKGVSWLLAGAPYEKLPLSQGRVHPRAVLESSATPLPLCFHLSASDMLLIQALPHCPVLQYRKSTSDYFTDEITYCVSARSYFFRLCSWPAHSKAMACE